jgi:hypothetical protein
MHFEFFSSLQWSASPYPFRTTLDHLPCHGHLSPFTHLGSLTSAADWGSHHWIPISLNPFKLRLALRPLIWRGLLLVLLLSRATFIRKNFTQSFLSFAQTLKEIAKVRRHALLCASVFEISRLIVYVAPSSVYPEHLIHVTVSLPCGIVHLEGQHLLSMSTVQLALVLLSNPNLLNRRSTSQVTCSRRRPVVLRLSMKLFSASLRT